MQQRSVLFNEYHRDWVSEERKHMAGSSDRGRAVISGPGILGEPANRDECMEGLDRTGGVLIYKSHHRADELPPNETQYKIVSILRDPRDVLLSMERYFSPLIFYQSLQSLQGKRGSGILERTIKQFRSFHRRQIFQALVHGIDTKWLESPWGEHVSQWSARSDAIQVRYEDLLDDPIEQLTQLFKMWNVRYEIDQISAAVDRQSFDKKKQELLRSGQVNKAKFLKVGRSRQWERQLSNELIEAFSRQLGPEMARHGYH